MADRTLKKNVILNGLQQAVTYILPFVTIPYLTRIIGKDGLGTYDYTNSIIQYFILFGTIGLTLFGTRQIAYDRGDSVKCNRTFWKLLYLRLFFCGIALVLYLVFLQIVHTDLKIYMYMQILALAAAAIDIVWYFQGIEEFQSIVPRFIACKLAGTACIFIFVKSREDVEAYVLIHVLMLLVSNAVLWAPAVRRLKPVKIAFREIFEFLPAAVRLFIPQIAIELYAVFDKTMLGKLSSVGAAGLYTKAEQFAKVPLMLIGVLATVLFPRMSSIFTEKGEEGLKQSLNSNIKLISVIGIGSMFGLIGISEQFVPWMMGDDFLECVQLLRWLAPLAFIIGMSNMIGRQYLLPSDQSRVFTITVTIGAAINFVLNIILIKSLGAAGACIATIIAELAVAASQFVFVIKKIELGSFFSELLKCVVSGAVMAAVVIAVGKIINVPVLNTAVQVIIGCVVYALLLIVLKNGTALAALESLKARFKR